ncbi:glycosyltransferase family 4 protein [Candidatus Uhrbacteria bacterium]|nr:glycosyltransferase family 4 protein [Candidatus Uhrbacteria bacterium]
MRIFIDGATLCGSDGSTGAGIEHYTWSLVSEILRQNELEDQIILFVPSQISKHKQAELLHGAKNVRIIRALLPYIPFVSRHIFLPLRAFFFRADIFFSPFGQLPFLWRWKSVITVHDVLIYDHPEWFPREMVDSFSTRFIVPSSISKASSIICVSKWTEQRLLANFPDAKNKTCVITEGVELGSHKEVEHKGRFPFDRDYVLMLGTIEPRKNLANAFVAFEHFLETHPEQQSQVRLIVAGKFGWKSQEIIESFQYKNSVHFLGPVTEEEKWYLLSRATCLLFPSLEEGFGLPILEAMSVGTPVITSRRGALEEVGGDVVIYCEPDDTDEMSFAIAQCVLVPEGIQYLREEGYKRAVKFSWSKSARATLELFHSISQNLKPNI